MSATELLRAAAGALAWASVSVALAQAAPGETGSRQASRGGPVVTEQDLQRARERHRMPSDEDLRGFAPPAAPRIDQLPKPASHPPLDLEALSRGFQTQPGGLAPSTASGPSLLVFVTFAMPEKTLRQLADQAERAGATLVLRGLVDGSLVRTASRVRELLEKRRTAVRIDPLAFDRYAVTAAPSFVLLPEGASSPPCTTGTCAAADGYAIVSGDVSLDYALRHVRRTAPRFAKAATGFLQRLGP